MTNNKPTTLKDLALLVQVYHKGEDLVNYYGKTNASSEFYFEELGGHTLADMKQAVKALKSCGAFQSVGKDKNVFAQHDPSLGFTGWNKRHATTIDYYVTSYKALSLFLLTFKHLYPSDWRSR